MVVVVDMPVVVLEAPSAVAVGVVADDVFDEVVVRTASFTHVNLSKLTDTLCSPIPRNPPTPITTDRILPFVLRIRSSILPSFRAAIVRVPSVEMYFICYDQNSTCFVNGALRDCRNRQSIVTAQHPVAEVEEHFGESQIIVRRPAASRVLVSTLLDADVGVHIAMLNGKRNW